MSATLPARASVAPANHEQARLAALRRLDILDRPRRSDLDSIARLAAFACGTSIALVNLVDSERQWTAAEFGMSLDDLPRCDSMCAVSIESRDISYTPDASLDPRWDTNPFVTGMRGNIRLYASAPLIVSSGEAVGTLCVVAFERQELTRVQLERLRDLADLAVELMELHGTTERLGEAALRDPLTHLPNRALFRESLDLAVARSDRGHPAPALLFLDVDGFKGVNDAYGHSVGDELLVQVGARLVAVVRGSDMVARLGGDEFVVLCDGSPDDPPDPVMIERRIRAAFAAPFTLSCASVSIGVSIGVARGDGLSAAGLLHEADLAMYADKSARRAAQAG